MRRWKIIFRRLAEYLKTYDRYKPLARLKKGNVCVDDLSSSERDNLISLALEARDTAVLGLLLEGYEYRGSDATPGEIYRYSCPNPFLSKNGIYVLEVVKTNFETGKKRIDI